VVSSASKAPLNSERSVPSRLINHHSVEQFRSMCSIYGFLKPSLQGICHYSEFKIHHSLHSSHNHRLTSGDSKPGDRKKKACLRPNTKIRNTVMISINTMNTKKESNLVTSENDELYSTRLMMSMALRFPIAATSLSSLPFPQYLWEPRVSRFEISLSGSCPGNWTRVGPLDPESGN